MLPLLVFLLFATPVHSLTCHCVNSSDCGSNGYCPNGCRHLWSGPGCQVGIVSFNKTARQSTTLSAIYVASAAVDGNIPNDYATPISCTHTAETNPTGASWWVVTLDKINNYAILNITLQNRRTYNSNRLGNFVILFSKESEGDPDPNSTTRHEFARESGTVGDNRTYTPNNTVIAKQIAVYLKNFTENPQAILTLCEVLVIGYELNDCQSGFTGPGCLLRACNECVSIGGQCTGEFGSCRYNVCPDQSLLPPDCWKTLSNISGLDVRTTATCNSVILSASLNDTQPNIAASWLQLQVTTSSDLNFLENTTFALQRTNSVYYNISNTTENTSYNFTWKLLYCDSANNSCYTSTGSKELSVLTGKRKYAFNYNDSCVFFNVSSTVLACEPLSIYQIMCQSKVAGGVTVNSSNSSVCGLESEGTYNCTVTATANWNEIEIESGPIIIGPRSTTAAPKENITDATADVLPGANIGIASPDAIKGVLPGAIGGSAAVIVMSVATIAIVFCRRQKFKKLQASRISLVTNENDHGGAGTIDVRGLSSSSSATSFNAVDDQPYGNLSGMKLPQFQLYVQDEELIERRFSELQANKAHLCTYGKLLENKGKNRFTDITPYDLNRVRLHSAVNDYINASYINGFSIPNEYIAAQGPSSKTLEDFWQMLWQEECSVIIMLTDFVAHAKKKCEKYFPYSKTNEMDIEVTVRTTTVCDTHTVTVLNVRRGSEVRLVHHFHFLSWPDHCVPSHNAEMLLFHSRLCLHLKQQPSAGPVIVHCSAGVGRTGAYIAFDYVQKHYQSESTVDVDSCVVKLRDQRMFMVQTKEQYVFLHKAILYSLKTTRYMYDTVLLSSLARCGPLPSNSVSIDLATEWQELQAVAPKFDEQSFAAAMLPENRDKNRRSQILASESKRPILFGPDGGAQIYINAVYCNGCYSTRAFIATQLPLPDTVDDFWLMVYNCQPSCIILLHDVPDDDEDYPNYWPETGRSISTGWLEVKCALSVNEDSAMNARMPGLDISLSPVSGRMTDSQTVSTKLFTTRLWDSKGSEELPSNANDLVLVANALRSYCVKNPRQQIIVQCRDGTTQSGLFLSVVNALHRLLETDQVSVFHTVDLLRASRPEFVTSEAQYRYIYHVLETYHQTLSVYANT